ncbi:glycosyltransferase [Mycobacterium avium subsp. hominissuis]
MAVPPDAVGFVEAAGVSAFPYGLDTQTWLDVYRNFWTAFFGAFWKIRDLQKLWREMWELSDECWMQMSKALTSVADGADVLLVGQSYQEVAVSVAEYLNIPLATLHHVPARANGELVPILPAPLARSAMSTFDWLGWLLNRKVEQTQRRELGLPKAKRPAAQRIAASGALEIQAYDEVCFPGLAAEWAKWNGQRPFVGTLTMELATGADDEVASWIAGGTPPICFGFGSMPVQSPADTIEMIGSACAELGERALICAGWSDFSSVRHGDHVKVVGGVNYATVFPSCRAVVHHGGSGTTAASLRAGVPTLILSMDVNQKLWGAAVKRLRVGTCRQFSRTTRKSLVTDLRRILTPEYSGRARELAARMTRPAESIAAAADAVEAYVRSKYPA